MDSSQSETWCAYERFAAFPEEWLSIKIGIVLETPPSSDSNYIACLQSFFSRILDLSEHSGTVSEYNSLSQSVVESIDSTVTKDVFYF